MNGILDLLVASSLHNKADVFLLCKLYTGDNVIRSSNVDRVGRIVAKPAGRRCGCEWVARLVLEEGVHHLGRMGFTSQQYADEMSVIIQPSLVETFWWDNGRPAGKYHCHI